MSKASEIPGLADLYCSGTLPTCPWTPSCC